MSYYLSLNKNHDFKINTQPIPNAQNILIQDWYDFLSKLHQATQLDYSFINCICYPNEDGNYELDSTEMHQDLRLIYRDILLHFDENKFDQPVYELDEQIKTLDIKDIVKNLQSYDCKVIEIPLQSLKDLFQNYEESR